MQLLKLVRNMLNMHTVLHQPGNSRFFFSLPSWTIDNFQVERSHFSIEPCFLVFLKVMYCTFYLW